MKKILLALITLSFHAHADLLIEPFVGVHLVGSVENGDSFDSTDTDSATTVGAKVGYASLVGFQAGVDYRIMNHSFDPDESGYGDFEYTHNLMYAFIGYQFPVLFRIYVGVRVMGEGEALGNLSGSELKLESDGMTSTLFGFSYTGLPLLAINLEVVSYAWTDQERTYGGVTTTGSSDFEGSHYLLSLSLPLTL